MTELRPRRRCRTLAAAGVSIGLSFAACGGDSGTAPSAPAPPLEIVGGTYTDRDSGLIGTAFLFNPITGGGSLPEIAVRGPASWNGGSPLRCPRYQPPGASASRSMRWEFLAPITGAYTAQGAVGGQEFQATLSIDASNQLGTPQIILPISINSTRVELSWAAPAGAQSFLVRVNPDPFSGVITSEVVVSASTRTAALSGFSLVRGAPYQAVVFAFSRDVGTPDVLVAPFNVGAHGVVFTGP